MRIEIIELTQVTDAVAKAFASLIPQLSPAPPPSKEDLETITADPGVTILLAVDREKDDKIIGTLTLGVFRTPMAIHAWIEDVVVDSEYRRQGIGEALTNAGMDHALESGAQFVDLTSRPAREAANRLYQKMGFQKRSTNLYRFTFQQPD
jgi:ribosomal protein S18 acetylase RimI-like enzyme